MLVQATGDGEAPLPLTACGANAPAAHSRGSSTLQVALPPQLLAWVREQSEVAGAAGSPLHGAVDVARLAVVGHSRGAKLAALMLAGG